MKILWKSVKNVWLEYESFLFLLLPMTSDVDALSTQYKKYNIYLLILVI